MLAFIGKRLFIAMFLLLAMSALTFALMRLTPGNYFDTLRLDPQVSPDTLARYEQMHHLNSPVVVQYFHWLKGLLQGELGYSFHYNVPVASLIGGRMGNTLTLSISVFLLTWLVALPLRTWAALRRGQRADTAVQVVSYVFLSIPGFFTAMVLLLIASRTGLFPLGGMHTPGWEEWPLGRQLIDLAWHLAVPTMALSLGSIAALGRIMRGNMLEELGKQYVLAARAKGLSEHRVVYVHALRNALNPMVTLLGYEFSALLSGAALMEIVTGWPGLGSLMLTAVRAKDIYLVMASMLMGGVMFIAGNLLADILLAKLDPRIRYGR